MEMGQKLRKKVSEQRHKMPRYRRGRMCKAVDRGMEITNVKLLEKHGGKSGSYVNR
jgi:hypothetical protein